MRNLVALGAVWHLDFNQYKYLMETSKCTFWRSTLSDI